MGRKLGVAGFDAGRRQTKQLISIEEVHNYSKDVRFSEPRLGSAGILGGMIKASICFCFYTRERIVVPMPAPNFP